MTAATVTSVELQRMRKLAGLLELGNKVRWQIADELVRMITEKDDRTHRLSQELDPASVIGQCRQIATHLAVAHNLDVTADYLYSLWLTAKCWPNEAHRQIAAFSTLRVLNGAPRREQFLTELQVKHGKVTHAVAVQAMQATRRRPTPSASKYYRVVVPDALRERLEERAETAGMPISDCIVEAVREWVAS